MADDPNFNPPPAEDDAKPKKPRVVRLSEIKTNSDRRWRRGIKQELLDLAAAVDEQKIHAYAIVLWDEENTPHAYWNTHKLGVIGTLRGVLVHTELDRKQHIMDAERVAGVTDYTEGE